MDTLVRCKKCHHSEQVSFAYCLRVGWPMCHGETMWLEKAPDPEKIEEATAKAIAKQFGGGKGTRGKKGTPS